MDNRKAAELLATGVDGRLQEIARVLGGFSRELSEVPPKVSAGVADKT
jgi:hypothetical protein